MNAIVFGGSRGIGAAIATRLAHDGYDVALTYVSRPKAAAGVVTEIEALGRQALAIRADSSDPVAIRDAVSQAIGRFGLLDAAVVNAGILRLALLADVTPEDLNEMLAVNVRGVFLAIQAAAASMRDGGRIVTIGSNTAVRAGKGSSVYAMTKAAVASMVQGIALDLAPRGITVNNVQPGPIETDMTASMIAKLEGIVPIGRVGQVREVAGLVSFLVGRDGGYATGASLTMDGGFVL